jgi:hypothetical protein
LSSPGALRVNRIQLLRLVEALRRATSSITQQLAGLLSELKALGKTKRQRN